MLETLIPTMVALITALAGYVNHLRTRAKRDLETREMLVRLVLGLAQTNLLHLGIGYIRRGHISSEEYRDLRKYMFEPYRELGGNGSVERIMYAVERLPFIDDSDLDYKIRLYRDVQIRETDETGIPQTKFDLSEEEEGERRERQESRSPRRRKGD